MDEISHSKFSELRKEMIDKAIFARGVRSELVLDAMGRVPRDVHLVLRVGAFLVVGHGRTDQLERV